LLVDLESKKERFTMTSEQFMKGCLNATPGTRAKIELLLNGDESVVAQPIADGRTCTQAEAARRLRVSRPTVIKWMKAGVLRSVNLTGIPRVLLTSVDDIARGKVSASDNPEVAKRIEQRVLSCSKAGRKGAAVRYGKGVAV
jgi:excisionase family DNA binding protein